MVNKNVRGGTKHRKTVKKIMKIKEASYVCPRCKKKKVSRISNAVWKCNSCDAVYTGGAYSFTTSQGKEARRKVALIRKTK